MLDDDNNTLIENATIINNKIYQRFRFSKKLLDGMVVERHAAYFRPASGKRPIVGVFKCAISEEFISEGGSMHVIHLPKRIVRKGNASVLCINSNKDTLYHGK